MAKSVNKMIYEFYKFMSETYIEYNKNKTITKENVLETDITKETETLSIHNTNTNTNSTKTFIDHFLFKLFYNYGIKRRMVNENIALLYYAKNIKGYKPSEAITIICRHMLLDTSNMRIVSIGIPKAFKLDSFCKIYDIDKTILETNFTKDDLGNKVLKYQINNFPEGTMITFNPSLNKYSITTINEDINCDNEDNDIDINGDNIVIDKATKELLDNNIEIKFNQQFLYSTRKVIGTGRFNSLKTFSEMFEDNNKITNTNLQNIPPELLIDTVLVFNIEHPDNKIISSNIRNCNTLCAVFKFKNEIISQEQFNKINSVEITEDNEEIIKNYFKELGNDMVTQIPLDVFKSQIETYNINIQFPEVIKTDKDSGLNFESDISFEMLQEIVNNKPKDFQGYIIYGINGERTKILNSNYKEMVLLKGNKPIMIDKSNIKNLFYLYWRLEKQNKTKLFIDEFEISHDINSENTYTYTNLFNWFFNLIKIYSLNLFKIYHNAFVRKTILKPSIPYTMKPQCGDLHKLYLSNKVPITLLIVNKYINEQQSSKLFWRLFMY